MDRTAIKAEHLVYLLVADKPQRYEWKRSPILYIGTTARGVARIANSAAHRADAFAACEALIDEVKATVPIWKHQFFLGGDSEWVNSA